MNQNSKPEPKVFDIADVPKKGEFANCLAQADYGDKIIYSRGLYAGGPHREAAMGACEAGLVALVQKRTGKGNFDYIAQRTRKRIKV